MKVFPWVLMMWGLLVGSAFAERVLVLTSTAASSGPEISGPAEWVDEGRCPASTFKVFLSWVALEEGLAQPGTRLPSADKHVPGTPREITLHQAMFYSSNDYFVQLFAQVPQKTLDRYLLRSGLTGEKVPAGWLKNAGSISAGGNLRVSPRNNHEFMKKAAFGKLASTPAIQAAWESVLRWPGPVVGKDQPSPPTLYGKTGVYGGAVWFNGFGDSGERRVCTVFLPGSVAQRARAISTFYGLWKLSWDPAWQEWLER